MILLEATRGEIVESIHRGHIVVVNCAGEIMAWYGNPRYYTYIRSAAKPLQVVSIVEHGVAEHFGFDDCQLAVMTGSHIASHRHVEVVRSILDCIGVHPTDLMCGAQWPLDRPSADRLVKENRKPEPIHNNCSGKHAAMLALARYYHWPLEGYWLRDHPVQKTMLDTIGSLCGYHTEKMGIGIDGCGVPVYAMPLSAMATGYARLGTGLLTDHKRRRACNIVKSAMLSYPVMVAGEGQFCTTLMRAGDGRVLAKAGAEAVYCLSLPEHGLGVAIKIEDGNNRAVAPVVLEVLNQLNLGILEQWQKFQAYHMITNRRGETVGSLRPVFRLSRGV